MMTLNDLLAKKAIDPRNVVVFRHRPHESELRKVLPWLAVEKPIVFNAYQQTQGPNLESAMHSMVGRGFVASFIGHEPGKALFVGLYSIDAWKPLTYRQFWRVPEHLEMKAYGFEGWLHRNNERRHKLWFDLTRTDIYADWKGRLVVRWPAPELSWWRRAHRNVIPVTAILEESALAAAMPEWTEIVLTWADLAVLPARWRAALSQWRGIYYIFDISEQKGYVGSAYGNTNLLGRWRNYAARGDGGNALLRGRDPANFRFTILQRVSPDMEAADVIRLEGSWKERLHTRQPYGLNDN